MAIIVTRSGKGSPLTNNEVDANFVNLNTELGTKVDASSLSSYQPLDGDLTAIAGLIGTSGVLRKDAANTWSLDTSTYLTAITSGQITAALGYTPAASGANSDITSMTGITGGISSPDFIQFDTAATVTPATGRLFFNDGEGGLAYTLKGGNVIQEVGQSQQVLVYNGTGATLTKGQVVYSNGAQGQRPTVALALATGDATSARTLGIVAESIANGAEGWVTTLGIIENIDTSAFTAGAQLYLSGSTAGGLTATKPHAPLHMVYVARCIKSHAAAGRLFVTVQNGYEMDELHNVSAQTPSNNDGLFYNTSTSLWENKSIVTALGYTPYNATNPSGYITSSALSAYLPLTGGSLNVGGVSSTHQFNYNESGGEIQLIDSTGAGPILLDNFSGLARLYKVGTGAMSIGTTGANYLQFITNGSEAMRISSAGNVGIGTTAVELGGTFKNVILEGASGGIFQAQTTSGAQKMALYADSSNGYVGTRTNNPVVIVQNNTERMRIDSSGNVGIGTSPSGDRLNVAGTAQFTNATYCFAGVTSGSVQGQLAANAGGTVELRAVTNHPLAMFTNNTERMRINSNGVVGIGTSVDNGIDKLTVAGIVGSSVSGRAGFHLYNGGATAEWFMGQPSGSSHNLTFSKLIAGTYTDYFAIDTVGGITSANLADAVGYKGLPQNQRTGAYTLALSDIGKHLYVTAGAFAVTIPADATLNFPVGAAITFVCEDAAKTIVPASGVVLILAGTGAATTGTRTLAIGAVATLIKVQANRWYISGSGVT